jgi:probable selenium-dependent hydroxylase accessory protein YqeC
VRVAARETLAGALGLQRRESVALVGSGGKTGVLLRLARDVAATGDRVIVTTTTAMFLSELCTAGPVVIDAGEDALVARLAACLKKHRVAGAARSHCKDGKVVGLPPATVDRVWAEGLADCLIVEADGSRGRPLKAFGPHEPQVPASSTVIVQVAGVDAVGEPLTDEHVHRAGVLAAALAVPIGSQVTESMFVDCLREQLGELRRGWPEARVVTVLNKADGPAGDTLGRRLAERLLAPAAEPRRSGGVGEEEHPDGVVVSSLLEDGFAVVATTESDPG